MSARIPLAAFASLLLPGLALGQSVTTFSPDTYITPGAAPTSAETAALDAAAGLSGFVVEDFEDAVYVPGLTVTPGLGESPPNPACGDVSLIPEDDAVWDGSLCLNTNLMGSFPVVLQYISGADAIAVGVSGFAFDHELVVNGTNFGAVTGLPGFESKVPTNQRNLYIRIDREPGGPPITKVTFLPDPLMPGANGDCVRIDHVAISPASVCVPALGPLALGLLILGVVVPGLLLVRNGR